MFEVHFWYRVLKTSVPGKLLLVPPFLYPYDIFFLVSPLFVMMME